LCAPAHTPAAIVDKLNGALNDALSQPDVQRRLADTAAEPTPMGSEQFAIFLKTEVAKWTRLVKDAGIQILP
jgi:tripartite-type tricarboxylate transporter receptor subunit TctC